MNYQSITRVCLWRYHWLDHWKYGRQPCAWIDIWSWYRPHLWVRLGQLAQVKKQPGR
jgi:hypothetical protein